MAQGQNPYVFYNGTINNIGNGTSYSCPIMAGMIACLWQAYPNKTNQEIKQLVIQSADNFSPIVKERTQFGYGIPDFNLALSNGLSVNSFSKNDFVVYPNPTSEAISVSLPEGIDFGNTIIYSVLGQKILEKTTTKHDPFISLKFLNKGTYLYKIESNGFSKSGKIIKQ
jgi:subtilisin family serine protease